MKEHLLYLLLSVTLSAGRNIISKKTAIAANDTAQFFLSQSVLFGAAALLFITVDSKTLAALSMITFLFGIVYGVLLILSQWMLTIALKSGNTSVCTVIYSLGFILPTISGVLFWDEPFTVLNLIGICIAIAVILLTVQRRDREEHRKKTFIPFILIAMTASGGLGIMQKVQQSTHAANEKGAFLLIAFVFAFCTSGIAFLLCRQRKRLTGATVFFPAVTGVCFGGANLCNTILAGKMKSAVFFPLQNISTILLSTFLGILIFKEKLTPKTVTVLILGTAVVVLFSI